MQVKVCKHCATEYPRNPKFSKAQWESSDFCSRGCATRWKAKHDPRPVAAGTCADCGNDAARLRRGRCQRCYDQDRYRTKREQILETNRRWREANPDYFKQERLRQENVRRALARYHGDLELHALVLERDDYTCQQCGHQGPNAQGRNGVCVHHIDGDRSNRVAENLTVLCNPCHARLHVKRGDYFGGRVA